MFESLSRVKRTFLERLVVLSTTTAMYLPCLSPAQSVTRLPTQEVEDRPAGEELVGPYAQPRWSARGRFSADTDVYVLPPYSFYVDPDYDGTFPRNGQPDHLFAQEYELGLPCRTQIAWEFYQEAINGHRQIPYTLVEARYALADWGKKIRSTLRFWPNSNGAPERTTLARKRIIGHDSPYLETFVIFSIDFGTGETKELEEPTSTHFHR
jgi:hypothetical protein